MVSPLILPGDPEFYETLENPEMFDWRRFADLKGSAMFVVRAETGMLDCVTSNELIDYIHGGEYQERLSQMAEIDLY